MAKKHYIIPIFVPHKGCPFDCIFCNQKKITGLTTDVTSKEVEDTIKSYIETIEDIKDKHVEIAFFGGSFTGIELSKQEELLSVAAKWKENGVIKDIRLSTRPDYIDETMMRFLKKFGVSIIELGVQSMDQSVLTETKRGHTPMDVINAVEVMRRFDVKIGLQMMVGLPNDDLEKVSHTADQIIGLAPDFVRIYPTLVVRDTYLEKMYVEEKYQALSVEEAVDICKKILLKFLKNNIPVIRIGLQPTENILLGRGVIAGPFHSSFRQLVESEILKDVLDHLFFKFDIKNKALVELQVNDRGVSSLVGHKKKNIKFIRQKYKVKKIKIIRNNDLNNEDIKILIQDEKEIKYNIKEFIDNAI